METGVSKSPLIEYLATVDTPTLSNAIELLNLLNRDLLSGKIAVDYKQVHIFADAVVDEPFQALSGVTEIAVFIEMNIAAMSDAEGHL